MWLTVVWAECWTHSVSSLVITGIKLSTLQTTFIVSLNYWVTVLVCYTCTFVFVICFISRLLHMLIDICYTRAFVFVIRFISWSLHMFFHVWYNHSFTFLIHVHSCMLHMIIHVHSIRSFTNFFFHTMCIPTANTSTKKFTKIYKKYLSPTCFGTEVPSSGSFCNKGLQSQTVMQVCIALISIIIILKL
jgi:hypothetical protein